MSDLLKHRAIDLLIEDFELQLSLMRTKQRLLAEMRKPLEGALEHGDNLAEKPVFAAKLRAALLEIEHKQAILAQNYQGTEDAIAQYQALRPAEEVP